MIDLNGLWVNQNGSTVVLEAVPGGEIKGWYCSRKGRSAVGKRYPVVGRQNGELLSFLVDWQDAEHNLEAMTAFSGRCVVDAQREVAIHTVWVLSRQFEDDARQKPTGAWNAFLTNADIFRRSPQD
jgi:hypothetical protein